MRPEVVISYDLEVFQQMLADIKEAKERVNVVSHAAFNAFGGGLVGDLGKCSETADLKAKSSVPGIVHSESTYIEQILGFRPEMS